MTVNIDGLGKITAKPEVFATLVNALTDACYYNRGKGRDNKADILCDMSDDIYEALDSINYFKLY